VIDIGWYLSLIEHRTATEIPGLIERLQACGITPEILGKVLCAPDSLLYAPERDGEDWAQDYGGPIGAALLTSELLAYLAHQHRLAARIHLDLVTEAVATSPHGHRRRAPRDHRSRGVPTVSRPSLVAGHRRHTDRRTHTMSTHDSPALSDLDAVELDIDLDAVELDILAELRSPEAVDAFEMLHAAVPVETGSRFAELLAIINDISGPNFAVDASLDLLDAVQDSGDLALVVAATVDDPITALALAQLLRTIHQD
jgi:hypothetical protein